MKRTLVLASCLCLFACISGPESQSAGSEGPRNADVDAVFADLVGMRPGAAVGVVMSGEVVHRAGYGIANMDHSIPITPETVFDIASISKQFGAMAALLLEAQGSLGWKRLTRATVIYWSVSRPPRGASDRLLEGWDQPKRTRTHNCLTGLGTLGTTGTPSPKTRSEDSMRSDSPGTCQYSRRHKQRSGISCPVEAQTVPRVL